MADIGSITQGSSYTGNAALGGALGVGVTIDPSPLQRLATFTFYRDRDKWEKKNADDKIAAEKIAAMTAYDITSPLKPFSDDLKSLLKNIQSFVRDNPDSLVWSRSPEKYQKLEEMVNDFLNKRKGATTNGVIYEAHKAGVERIQDPQERELRRRELGGKVDKLFVEGLERAYNTTMDSLPELKQGDYEIPSVAITTRDFVAVDPNNNLEVSIEYGDLDDLKSKAELKAAEPVKEVDINADWFKRLTPDEQKIELDKETLAVAPRKALQKVSVDFNDLLKKWQAANPNIDITTVDPTTLPDGTLENNIKSVLSINKQIDELNKYVAEGKVMDKVTGLTRSTPYGHIELGADGLTEAELIMMKSLQKNGNALIKKIDKNIAYTGDQTKRRGQDLDFKAAWARATTETKPPDAIENPARIFGTHIDRVKNYYSTHDPKTSRMTVPYSLLDDDTRKALGIASLAVDATDEVKKDYNNKYVVYNPDGSFKVGVMVDKNNKASGGTPGTLEQLRKGFIDVVKTGMDEKGVQSEGFQTNAENGFYKIFGVNNAQTIWDGWNKQGVTQAPTPNQGTTKTSSSSGGGGVVKFPLPAGQARTVKQKGVTFTWDEETGKYKSK